MPLSDKLVQRGSAHAFGKRLCPLFVVVEIEKIHHSPISSLIFSTFALPSS